MSMYWDLPNRMRGMPAHSVRYFVAALAISAAFAVVLAFPEFVQVKGDCPAPLVFGGSGGGLVRWAWSGAICRRGHSVP